MFVSDESFYERVLEQLYVTAPSARSLISDVSQLYNLVSPTVTELNISILTQAQDCVRELFALSRTQSYQEQLPQNHREWLKLSNLSVLMAYDFHLTPSGLKLIEINTNASGFLVSSLLHLAEGLDDPRVALLKSFQEDWSSLRPDRPLDQVWIADANLKEQKMLVEHFMYQDLFRKHGWESQVVEWESLQSSQLPQFIYNRHTDFYLQQPNAQRVRNATLQGEIALSPSPKEYLLLADKERLLLIQQMSNSLSASVRERLLKIASVQNWSADTLWSDRKRWYFKPQQSHGGKSVYRGETITRKVFERVYRENFLAQEVAPAPYDQEKWKFDLRFYVYGDRVQHVTARRYQGQLTNFNSALGGFSRVRFVSN